MHYKNIFSFTLLTISFVSLILPSTAYPAGWIDDNISVVAVKYGNGCIKLNNGEQIKLDLNSPAGRAELSIALSAQATNKKLKVYQNDGPLEGGCDTGTTIKPHSMLLLVE